MTALILYLFVCESLYNVLIYIRGIASIYARTPVRTAEIWKKKFIPL